MAELLQLPELFQCLVKLRSNIWIVTKFFEKFFFIHQWNYRSCPKMGSLSWLHKIQFE